MIRILKKEEILKTSSFESLFGDKLEDNKKMFHAYCKKYHPDVNGSPEAATIYTHILEIYNKETKHTAAGINPSGKKDIIRCINEATGRGFELINPIVIVNQMNVIYHTDTKILLLFEENRKQFYDNYIKQNKEIIEKIKSLEKTNPKLKNQFEPLFPKVKVYFKTTGGKYAILLEKRPDVLNLGEIVRGYAKKGEKFPFRHSIWIMNRLYNLECFFDFISKTYNGFSIENIWVSTEMHAALIFDGLEYTVNTGDAMIGLPKSVFDVMPVDLKGTKAANQRIDLKSIRNIGRILYQESDNISKFLDSGLDIKTSAIDDWTAFDNEMLIKTGKREFIAWENIPYAER